MQGARQFLSHTSQCHATIKLGRKVRQALPPFCMRTSRGKVKKMSVSSSSLSHMSLTIRFRVYHTNIKPKSCTSDRFVTLQVLTTTTTITKTVHSTVIFAPFPPKLGVGGFTACRTSPIPSTECCDCDFPTPRG